MKRTLSQQEADRRAFLEPLKPQLAEILEAAGRGGPPIDYLELRADVAAELAEARARFRARQ
jgi:hypothetical protein